MLLVCLWLVGLKKQQYIVSTAVRNKFSLNRTSASLTGIISTEYIDNVINEHYFVFVHLNTITEKTNNMVLPSFCVRVFQYHYREDWQNGTTLILCLCISIPLSWRLTIWYYPHFVRRWLQQFRWIGESKLEKMGLYNPRRYKMKINNVLFLIASNVSYCYYEKKNIYQIRIWWIHCYIHWNTTNTRYLKQRQTKIT